MPEREESKKKAGTWRLLSFHACFPLIILRARLFRGRELRRLQAEAEEGPPREGKKMDEGAVLSQAGKWFALLERMGLKTTCLTRSLALAGALRKEGHHAGLAFGVRGDGLGSEGHCWVTVEGRAVTRVPDGYLALEEEKGEED
jgi:hypothetical protein